MMQDVQYSVPEIKLYSFYIGCTLSMNLWCCFIFKNNYCNYQCVCVCVWWKDLPCSLSGRLVTCEIGNPLRGGSSVTSEIHLDATYLPATRHPLYIAVNVTTLVLAYFHILLCLYGVLLYHS